MVFAPKLEGGVAYNAPVQQPSAMEAVAGLFNFGLKTLAEEDSKTPKLTQDEKFAIAVKEFEESKGATFNWDRKGMREFIFNYPQFTSQATSYAENLGVMTAAPEEVARDAAVEWFKTPEGMLAVAESQRLPEDQREAYLAEQVTKVKQQEAKIAELERNAAQYTAEGTLLEKQWDVLKPTSKDMVDNTVSAILGPMLTEVSNGVTVEIPPELQAQLGIRYSTVDMNNIGAVLSDAKVFLSNQARGAYTNQFGQDALPSEDWNKEVFAGLDSLVEVSKAFDTPQERASTLQALIDTEMYKKLDENGVAVITRLAQTIPAETLGRLIPMMSEFDSKFMEVLTDNGSILTTKGIQDKVTDTSKAEAEALASDTIQFFEHGFVPEFFTLFKESAKKSGFNVVDATSFKKIAGDHIKEITTLASTNPEFRAEFGGWLTSDIQQTISILNSNLSVNNFKLVFDGKKFVIELTGDPQARLEEYNRGRKYERPPITEEEIIKRANLPEGMNLDTLNQKVATLGLMGEFGKEIQGAIGILNTNPEKPTTEPTRGRGETPRGRGRGRDTVTASSKGGTDIGTALGIDFASMEAEAGLPGGYLNKVAMIESGGNPNAQNPNSSAGGLFQQIDSNAAAYGVEDKFDPMQSAQGAVAFAVENKNYLTRVLGREPTGGELYLAHQQGPGGAAKLLSNPESKAVDIVGADAVRLNGGNENMSAGEFANIWISKYNGSRGQTTGQYASAGGSPSLSLDSGAREVPEGAQGPSTATTEPLQGNLMSFDSPEVQQIIEKSQSAPEEAIRIAKEVLAGKPMDPAIKSLIEALVRIGEKA